MIVQLDLEGNVIAQFPTITEAQEATGAESTNIRAVLRGKRNRAGGFKWEERFEEIEEPQLDGNNLSSEWKEDTDQATFTGRIIGEELTTLEEVLQRCKVDLSVWEVKTHTLKHWTTTMKKKTLVDPKSGKAWKEGVPFIGTPVTAHEPISVLNTGWTIIFQHKSDYKERLVEMLKTNIAALRPTPAITRSKGKYAVEFMITDHHLGKDGFDLQTLKPLWSIDEAMSEYQKVIDFGLSRIDLDNVQEFWLPTGNDLLHTEGNLATTTSGTKVGGDQLWLQLFRMGKEAVSLAIQTLSQYAPVKAYFIPGNHDQSGVLAMSEVIKAIFQNDPNVTVFCNEKGRDWATFGNNLIGWHHGNRCDARKAHTMMISDVPHKLHVDQYRAVHVGHTHRSAKTETVTLNTLNEEFGLVYEICPSLTATDVWHSENLYIGNLRRSKIFCYEHDKGLEAEYIYNLGR